MEVNTAIIGVPGSALTPPGGRLQMCPATRVDSNTHQLSNEMQLGKAGEYLVCADLILQGYVAYPSEQGLSYDVVVDVGGELLRIQVKTTQTIRPIPQRATYRPAYLFHARRCGKGGRRSYSDTDIDLLACVALDRRMIAYLPIHTVRQSIQIRTLDNPSNPTCNKRSLYMEELTFAAALAARKGPDAG